LTAIKLISEGYGAKLTQSIPTLFTAVNGGFRRMNLPDNVNFHVHRPACPKCRSYMILARIMPARVGFDIRTFECPKCDLLHEVMVETDAFGQSFTPTA
jgi:hypothetical protein